MYESRPEGLSLDAYLTEFLIDHPSFLPYPVGGWRSRRLNNSLPRERCRPWPVRVSTDSVIRSATPSHLCDDH